MKTKKVRLVFTDWRKIGQGQSIYNTEQGIALALGDLHSGTTFETMLSLPKHIMDEIEQAYNTHKAYPVFSVLPKVPEK